MAYISAVKIDSGAEIPVTSSLYGTCNTAAGTAAKVVTMPNFDTLKTGVLIHVKFTYGNTAASPTLNVNDTGAKTIYRYGTTVLAASTNGSWWEGSIIPFIYDGNNWYIVNWSQRTNDYVTQTATTNSANYRVLLSATADNTTRTEGARKSSNLMFNPSTGALYSLGYNRIDITSQTVDINNYNLSAGEPMSQFYRCRSDGGAANITNIPVAGKPFLLDVELIRWTSTTNYITRQTFRNANNPNNEYVRFCTNGTWGSWITRVFTNASGNGFEIVYSGSYTGTGSMTSTISTNLSTLPDYLLIVPNAPSGTGTAAQTAYNSSSIYIPIEQDFSWSSTTSYHGTGVTVSGYLGTSTSTLAFTAASGIVSCTYPSDYSTNITFTLTGKMSSNIAIVGTGQTSWANRTASGWTAGQYLIAYNHSGITYKYYFLKAS